MNIVVHASRLKPRESKRAHAHTEKYSAAALCALSTINQTAAAAAAAAAVGLSQPPPSSPPPPPLPLRSPPPLGSSSSSSWSSWLSLSQKSSTLLPCNRPPQPPPLAVDGNSIALPRSRRRCRRCRRRRRQRCCGCGRRLLVAFVRPPCWLRGRARAHTHVARQVSVLRTFITSHARAHARTHTLSVCKPLSTCSSLSCCRRMLVVELTQRKAFFCRRRASNDDRRRR